MLRQPVIFMTGLYLGGNRYRIHFEVARGFFRVPAAERDSAIRGAVERFAAVLERHCRDAPYNWFNFFDFWQTPPDRRRNDSRARSDARQSHFAPAWRVLLSLGARAPAPPGRRMGRRAADAEPRPAAGGRVAFVEQKYIAMLDRPVESSGELVYLPPLGWRSGR